MRTSVIVHDVVFILFSLFIPYCLHWLHKRRITNESARKSAMKIYFGLALGAAFFLAFYLNDDPWAESICHSNSRRGSRCIVAHNFAYMLILSSMLLSSLIGGIAAFKKRN